MTEEISRCRCVAIVQLASRTVCRTTWRVHVRCPRAKMGCALHEGITWDHKPIQCMHGQQASWRPGRSREPSAQVRLQKKGQGCTAWEPCLHLHIVQDPFIDETFPPCRWCYPRQDAQPRGPSGIADIFDVEPSTGEWRYQKLALACPYPLSRWRRHWTLSSLKCWSWSQNLGGGVRYDIPVLPSGKPSTTLRSYHWHHSVAGMLQFTSCHISGEVSTIHMYIGSFMAYQHTIIRASRNYEGSTWVIYDRCFHQRAGATKSLISWG